MPAPTHPAPSASTAEPLELRRKRLIHRSLYTGMKETDLLLGAFARAMLPRFDARQLDLYEALLAEPDPAIFAWAIGREAPPAEHDNEVMAVLRDFTKNHRP